jgi:hypothetical protein
VKELICPPSGRLIDVHYKNGDRFRVEYLPVVTAADLAARYPDANVAGFSGSLKFPLVVAEILEMGTGTAIQFTPKETKFATGTRIGPSFFAFNAVGVQIGDPRNHIDGLFVESEDE